MRKLCFVVCLLLTLPGLARAQERATTFRPDKFALKDGDRVVFYGDSITDQRLYTTFTETYVVTRFPKMNVTFIHSGWGGDRVTGGGGGSIDQRLERDVIAYKPTVMTVMLGMNDASYRAFDQKIFDTYVEGYRHIVEKVKKEVPGIRLTLIVPSPFDDVTRKPNFEGGYNAVLLKYGEFVKELAAKEGGTVADLNTSVVEATKKANDIDPKNAPQLNGDRVHPGPGGQLLMAEALLKAWDAPAVVTRVELIAGKNPPEIAVEGTNTKVSDLKAESEGLTWTQHDESLPFPINTQDSITALAVKASDVVQALDEQPLIVKGLPAENYTLKIDGDEIGTFTKAQLAEGINLATLSTPMTKQAARVHRLTLEHNTIHFTRWRQVQVPLQSSKSPNLRKALEALDGLEAEVVKEQRDAAQPQPRKYELRAKS